MCRAMASLPNSSTLFLSYRVNHFTQLHPNPNPKSSSKSSPRPLLLRHRKFRFPAIMASDNSRNQNSNLQSPDAADYSSSGIQTIKPPVDSLSRLAISVVLSLGVVGVRVCLAAAASTQAPAIHLSNRHTVLAEEQQVQGDEAEKHVSMKNFEDEDLKAEFEKWKSRTYALTVPLRIVTLNSSVPPSWITDFMQSQGRRAKLQSETRGSLSDIFSDLCTNLSKGTFNPKSAVMADIVTVGDSWLNFAIRKGLVEPLHGVEDQDWFKGLSNKWKVYLCRNNDGDLDPEGDTWAAPYRWGTMVIAYKKNKFQMHNLAPIEDWADLWRPELAGKISMVDSPREVVGAVLKSMGASYNTKDMDAQVNGGKKSVQERLLQLRKQVRLFDSVHYLKAFGVGDVWVAVGWSSDVVPAAKRMSNVSVIVPKSGASLWADLWAIPAVPKSKTHRIGGRVRGPSPLVHQWLQFCLQEARALPFRQEVIPGSSPSFLDSALIEMPKDLDKGKPKLDTNLVTGVPPADILDRCEFLEPLSDTALADYQWLIACMQKPHYGSVERMGQSFSSVFRVTNGQLR